MSVPASEAPDAAAIATSPEAFEVFYREHLPLIRTFLARRVVDPGTAADLTGDVFLRALQTAGTYRSDLGPPRAWLIGISRNVVADHYRSKSRELRAVNRLNARRWLDDESTQRIVERISAEKDARDLLASIADLPETLRDVVELVAVDGLPVTDAATLLNITPGTARVRYHRARRLLRTSSILQAHEVTP